MRPGGDPVIAAILAQKGFIERALVRLRVPAFAHDDLAFLFVVATRLVCRWFRDNPPASELREHAADTIDAETRVIAKTTLRYLRRSTIPERWRAIRSYANGVPVHAIAAREHVPTATIYNRLRLAREDFAAALAREDAAIFIRRRK
jgi:DNA-directed RNA polymerase specialized sigma24 family protein